MKEEFGRESREESVERITNYLDMAMREYQCGLGGHNFYLGKIRIAISKLESLGEDVERYNSMCSLLERIHSHIQAIRRS